MFLCGDASPDARRLCSVTRAALDAAIAECGPGVRFSRIGAAVSKIAKREKCVLGCGGPLTDPLARGGAQRAVLC